MSTPHLESTTDPNEAIERAAGYLAAHPVELNVIWSLLCQRVVTGVSGKYWILEDGGQVVGVAMESPPGHSAAISPLSRGGAEVLAASIHDSGHRLSGVVGEAASASHLAGCWAECAKVPAVAEDAQRLYVLGRLALAEGVPGSLRRADQSERDLVITWWTEFQTETGLPAEDVSPGVDQAMSAGRLFVWDDGGARCVARATTPLGGISRIGAVYTPPTFRRRGYAAACVGAISQWVSDEEQANCILYTQLANPTSNAVYQRLGFVAVSELLAYRFGSGAR